MKKFLFLFSALAISVFSFSQLITISGINQLPQVGDTIYYNTCNDFGFEISGTGPVTNKLWDYSGLMTESQLYFYYVDPTTTEGYELFNDVNLAEGASGQNGYIYIKSGNYYLARKGANGDLLLNYSNDSALMFKFPITAGSNFSSSYTGTIFASGLDMIIDNGQVQIQADAQGTIILPNGTQLNNVLRVHIVETFSGKYDFGVGPMEILTVSDDFYYWFHEDYKMPVFVYGITNVGGMGNNQQSKALRYQPIEISSKNNIEFTKQNITLFPNPAKDVINILGYNNFDRALIYDVAGKLVTVVNVNDNTISLNGVSSGIYSIELNGNKQSFKTKIVVE